MKEVTLKWEQSPDYHPSMVEMMLREQKVAEKKITQQLPPSHHLHLLQRVIKVIIILSLPKPQLHIPPPT